MRFQQTLIYGVFGAERVNTTKTGDHRQPYQSQSPGLEMDLGLVYKFPFTTLFMCCSFPTGSNMYFCLHYLNSDNESHNRCIHQVHLTNLLALF